MDCDHELWMGYAIQEALKAKNQNEIPIGAIVVFKDKIISRAHNSSISSSDATSHAEINSIRMACKEINNYRLPGMDLYVTLEPCAMCYGAIIHARISRVIFGAYDPKTGVCGSSIKLHEQKCFNHIPEIIGGVLEEKCSLILKDFFNEKRN